MAAPSTIHLALFTRAPVAGATKTRLAQDLGAEAARDFHVACLQDAMEEMLAWQQEAQRGLGRPVALHGFITPADSRAAFAAAAVPWPAAFAVAEQAGNTLGERMERALAHMLAAAPGCALLVGADLPLLHREVFTAAVSALDGADAVLGPTVDGGYYLVGLKRPAPTMFAASRWGQGTVLQETLAAAHRESLSVAQVPVLPDVDEVGDVSAVLGHPWVQRLAGKHAVALLRRWAAEGRLPPAAG